MSTKFERYTRSRTGPKDNNPDRDQGFPFRTAMGAWRDMSATSARQYARAISLGDWKIDDTDWFSHGRTGAYVCRTEGLPLFLRDQARFSGWAEEHLSLNVECREDEWFDSVSEIIKMQGFSLVPARGCSYSTGWGGGQTAYWESNRPEQHSVLVDLSGPRDRANRYWITYNDFVYGKPTGMSKSVSRAWEHARRLHYAERMAERVRKILNNEIQSYQIVVQVLWRGQVVGEDSIGCVELEFTGPYDNGPTFEEQVTDVIYSNNLIHEAWEHAFDWADTAVDGAKDKAAEIIEGIALLPEYALKSVRADFDRKIINIAKKEA
jgi:hypothetical protein